MSDTKLERGMCSPAFKHLGQKLVGNYTPVSILGVASKVLERAVYVQLEGYLRENDILYGFQSLLRGSFSTETCLTHLTDHIHNHIFVVILLGWF